MSSLVPYFSDPLLRAPTVGAMLMCLAASLVGVIAYVRRRSLVGETLSHATYPGIILGAGFALLDSAMLFGAFLSALFALLCANFLQKRLKLSSDAALSALLVAFLGFGVLLASHLQFSHPVLYTQVQVFLYGQSATLLDMHMIMYGVLAALTALFLTALFHQVKAINFDREFSESIGLKVQIIDTLTLILLALAVVIGIRSVGVVLMSGMLVAPAVAARKLTHRLSKMLILSGVIGMGCGLFGTVLSVEIPMNLPTGPLIVLLAASVCIFALFFAPEQGLITRLVRIVRFRKLCAGENVLKVLWKNSDISADQVAKILGFSKARTKLILRKLQRQGWCTDRYQLTRDGHKRASRIVRLHRLWEVYLTSQLGIGKDKVHPSAEEMEHIITPAIELSLIQLLKNPKRDPHSQPIPEVS